MNGKTSLPIKAWKSEAARLTIEKDNLHGEFYRLKEEVKEVETIRRNVEIMARDERRTVTRDMRAEL